MTAHSRGWAHERARVHAALIAGRVCMVLAGVGLGVLLYTIYAAVAR